jgi:hypothetical protein
MLVKPILPFVETMLTYGCNLSCQGCTNYSDYNVGGWVSWSEGQEWLSSWLERVDIPDFGIMGGEPLLNPQCEQWIYGVRKLMPNSQIRFTTNGVLLDDNRHIVNALMDIGNCVIKISVHQPHEFYTQKNFAWLFKEFDWLPVEEHGIKRWRTNNNVRLQINFPQTFGKTFQGNYYNMMPHNNDPMLAFDECVQQQCPLLYRGQLYKCSSIALLPRVLDDWSRLHETAWAPFLNYQGINVGCTDTELDAFINHFGKAESICSMCPTKHDQDSMLSHVGTTTTKIKWIQNNVSSPTTRSI